MACPITEEVVEQSVGGTAVLVDGIGGIVVLVDGIDTN